jgi:hypothetical protein
MRTLISAALSVSVLVSPITTVAQSASPGGSESPVTGASIVGAWTLDNDLSDPVPERGQPGERRGGGGGRGRGGRGGGVRGGGGGGGFGRAGGGAGGGGDMEQMRRKMQAMRDIMAPADRLTITRTDSLVIITAGDGRTTRLAPDNKKVKDDSTGIERKTHWNGDSLVTEIKGAGPGKITETYAIDPKTHHLTITLQSDNARMPNGGVIHHVYVPTT